MSSPKEATRGRNILYRKVLTYLLFGNGNKVAMSLYQVNGMQQHILCFGNGIKEEN